MEKGQPSRRKKASPALSILVLASFSSPGCLPLCKKMKMRVLPSEAVQPSATVFTRARRWGSKRERGCCLLFASRHWMLSKRNKKKKALIIKVLLVMQCVNTCMMHHVQRRPKRISSKLPTAAPAKGRGSIMPSNSSGVWVFSSSCSSSIELGLRRMLFLPIE